MTAHTQALEARAREELLPCPFCGAADDHITQSYWSDRARRHPSYVKCEKCGAEIERASKEDAITAWNTRHRETHDASSGGVREALPTDRYGMTVIDRMRDTAENGTMPPEYRKDLFALLDLASPTPEAATADVLKWEGPAYEYGVTWGPEEAHPDRLTDARNQAIQESADAVVGYAKRINEAGKEASFLDAHRAILALLTKDTSHG